MTISLGTRSGVDEGSHRDPNRYVARDQIVVGCDEGKQTKGQKCTHRTS